MEKKYYAITVEPIEIDYDFISLRVMDMIEGTLDNGIFYDFEGNEYYQAETYFDDQEEENLKYFIEPHSKESMEEYIQQSFDDEDFLFIYEMLYYEISKGTPLVSLIDGEINSYFLYLGGLDSYLVKNVDYYSSISQEEEKLEIVLELVALMSLLSQFLVPDKMMVESEKETYLQIIPKQPEEKEAEEDLESEKVVDLVSLKKEEKENKFDADKLEKALRSRVVAQDEACSAIVDIIDKNIRYKDYGLKSNVLLVGPSGVGKTEIARSIAGELDLAMVIFDVSSCTASGYVGATAIDCIKQLYYASGQNIERTESGIIVLDEIDKIASSGGNETIGKIDVQHEFLKMLDGDAVSLSIGKDQDRKEITIQTKNITFIGSGAFSELYKSREKNPIGFVEKEDPLSKTSKINHDDIRASGLAPEFLRRFNQIIELNNLSKEDLKNILTQSKISSLVLYETALLKENNVKLIYDEMVLDKMVDKAKMIKGGASGLKAVVDKTLSGVVRDVGRFDSDEAKEVTITQETVEDPKQYQLVKKPNENAGK